MNDIKFVRGGVYYFDLGEGMGCEIQKTRPCVVLQNEIGNTFSPTLIVAPLSTRRPNQPTHHTVNIGNIGRESIVELEQIRAISKERCTSYSHVTILSRYDMVKIEECIKISLDIRG